MKAHILKRLNQLDASTQREVYYQHADRLMSIVLRYVPTIMDAEEIIQDSFVQIFSKIKHYDSKRGSFESWSAKIAVNYALMFLRKKKRLVFYEEDLHANILKVDNKALKNLATEEVDRIIKKLDDKYAIIFKLKAIEGFSHQEIAVLLDIKKEASRTIFSRAKKQLRSLFEIKDGDLFTSDKHISL